MIIKSKQTDQKRGISIREVRVPGNPSKFITPATYSIEIEGLLDGGWSERLAGMNVETIKRNNVPLVTILSGRLRDQAELLGVLNALYNLWLTSISVRRQDVP